MQQYNVTVTNATMFQNAPACYIRVILEQMQHSAAGRLQTGPVAFVLLLLFGARTSCVYTAFQNAPGPKTPPYLQGCGQPF